MMEVRPRHWGVALCAAIALHCCALIGFWAPSSAGTPAAGIGGIEVSLGPAGAAQGTATAVTEATVVEPVKATTAVAVEATPEELVSQLVETVAEVTPAEPEPVVEPVEPLVAAPPIELAEATPPPVPVAELAIEQKVVELAPLPDVPPAKPQPPEPVAAAPTPQPVPPEASPTPAPAPQATQAIQTAALSGDTGQGGNTKFDAAGIGNATPGGGLPGDYGGYNAVLSAWLQQHHEFPARAQRRKMYGETKVRFTIDRGGNLLDYEVVDSSGYKILDEAALETLKRASPMPPMPVELSGKEYNPTITLRFTPPA
jgi:protein TonB